MNAIKNLFGGRQFRFNELSSPTEETGLEQRVIDLTSEISSEDLPWAERLLVYFAKAPCQGKDYVRYRALIPSRKLEESRGMPKSLKVKITTATGKEAELILTSEMPSRTSQITFSPEEKVLVSLSQ